MTFSLTFSSTRARNPSWRKSILTLFIGTIEHTRVIIRGSSNILVICISSAKFYDFRSCRCSVEVTDGLDPVCDRYLKVWAWACNSRGYTATSIVPCNGDLKGEMDQSEQWIPTHRCSEIQTHVGHVNMIDTVSHSRDSSYVITLILVGNIPKSKQGSWRSIEDCSFTYPVRSVVSVSGINYEI